MKRILTAFALMTLGMMIGLLMARSPRIETTAQATPQATEGYILEHDADVAKPGSAPHKGPGRSTGYSFFEKAADSNKSSANACCIPARPSAITRKKKTRFITFSAEPA